MRMMIKPLVVAWLGLPTLAVAQDASRHAGLQAAFDGWIAAQGTTGALATGDTTADGAWTTLATSTDAHDLASVGKAVTAACVRALVDQERLAWSDSAASVLARAPDVSIAGLITHTAGLWPDSTQTVMESWLQDGGQDHMAARVLDLVNARPKQYGEPGRYQYNNENYALLGLMIEAVTNQPYFEACQSLLDLPGGIQPSQETAVFMPWGGLQASPEDYVSFLYRQFGPGSAVADDPFAYPHADLGGGAFYGLGMVFRAHADSHNFWHFGAHCFANRWSKGSFAVLWEGQVGAAAFYDACVDWDAMFDLDAALSAAAYEQRQ